MVNKERSVASFFPRNLSGLVVVIVFLYWVFFHSLVGNYDIWWHIRTGKIILSGFFPKKDIFSFTAAGRPWVLHEWASEVLFYLVYSNLGATGLILLRAVVVAAAAGLFYTTLAALCTGAVLPLLLTICFWGCLEYFGVLVRPQMFSILLFILVIRLYLFSRELGRDRGLFWLFPVLLAWINLHGGFALGFIFIGLCVAGETVDNLFAEGGAFAARQKRTNRLLAICAGAFALCVANPNTYQGLLYPFAYKGEASLPLYSVAEWHPASWINAREFCVFVIVAFALVWLSRPKVSFSKMATVLFLMFYTFRFQRVSIFFIICTLLFMAPEIERAVDRFLEKQGSAKRSSPVVLALAPFLSHVWETAAFRQGGRKVGANVSAFVFVALFCVAASLGYIDSLVPFGVAWNRFPSGNIKVLERYMPGGRVFNQYRWGGMLIYRFPEKRVFIDGRVDVYGNSVTSEYEKTINLEPGWKETLEKYKVDHILVESDSVMGRLLADLDPSWKPIARDKVSILFVKRKGEPQREAKHGAGVSHGAASH